LATVLEAGFFATAAFLAAGLTDFFIRGFLAALAAFFLVAILLGFFCDKDF
jgi:hypothetical protein